MVKTESTMLPLGSTAPPFSLTNVDGQVVTLEDFADSRALLVMFICNHCPYVIHVAEQLAVLGNEYMQKGVGVVAVSANTLALILPILPNRWFVKQRNADILSPTFTMRINPSRKLIALHAHLTFLYLTKTND